MKKASSPEMMMLNSLVEALGVDLTLRLIEARGGTRCCPSWPQQRPELIEILGESGFARFLDRFGADQFYLPMARQWRFEIYTKRGMKPKEIAQRAACTEIAVHQYRRRKRKMELDQRQFSLFAVADN